ncbi:WD40-repeat-containing domain protein [Radiomyces spectabilis]|uniref:WD40-repeat-containing domain protein n=1 Tax=Radiomyces spectabilis TaxID=64574 RepID=UPI00221FDC14|nr:WD40-repeat-containing domain protein [Radiomyces spectabilis]KAI8384877.1 WD40-repeat-containing domain protein [Radiomyces spectabilis]
MAEFTTLINKPLGFTPYDVKWVLHSARLCVIGATGHSTGRIGVYRMEEKHLTLVNETETSTVVRCGTFEAAEAHMRHVATGDFEGRLQIWDIEHLELPFASVKAHRSIINCIDGIGGAQDKGARELVTGSRDGCVKVWDQRQLEKPIFTARPKDDASASDIWAVAFGKRDNRTSRLVAAGFENGDIKLFDLASSTSQYLWHTNIGAGVCSIDIHTDRLIATTLHGVCIIDLLTGQSTKLPSPSETTMWAVRHFPQQSNLFAVAGGDGQLRLWDAQHTEKPVASQSLSKHPIIAFDWNRDKKGLYACGSFDQTIKIGFMQGI